MFSARAILGLLASLTVGVVSSSGASLAGPGGHDLRLINAVKRQDPAAARQLIAEGVDVDTRQGDGATALHWAAHRDDLVMAEQTPHPTAKLRSFDNGVQATAWHAFIYAIGV